MKITDRIILVTSLAGFFLALTASLDARPYGDPGRQGPPPHLKEKLLEKYDINGDGELDEDERALVQADREERRAAWKERIDTDGDGVISEEERQEAREDFRAEVHARILENYDLDGDGELSPEEREAFREDHPRRGNPETAQKIREIFDVNDNGQLDPVEREALRRALQNRRGQ